MRRVLTASGIALGIMAYALMHDLLGGLPFTRSEVSWGYWAAGLFVGGLLLILLDVSGEWLFGGDQPWERPRRTTLALRLVIVALVVALVAVVVAVLSA